MSKHTLHYSEVRGDVLRPTHDTNTYYSVGMYILKGMTLDSNKHKNNKWRPRKYHNYGAQPSEDTNENCWCRCQSGPD